MPAHALKPEAKRFAELYQLTGNATRSYEEAYKCSRRNALMNAWKALRRPAVQAYLEELEGEARAAIEVTREEMIEWLMQVIHTPVSELDDDSPLIQEFEETEDRRKVKMPSKMDAARELIRICGFVKPQELKLSADDELAAVIRAVTGVKE